MSLPNETYCRARKAPEPGVSQLAEARMGRNSTEDSVEEKNSVWNVRCADLTTLMWLQQALANGSAEKYHAWSCSKELRCRENPISAATPSYPARGLDDLAMSTP